MHKAQLQYGNSDRLQVDMTKAAEGQNFSEERKP
jgi:hypothetical protein